MYLLKRAMRLDVPGAHGSMVGHGSITEQGFTTGQFIGGLGVIAGQECITGYEGTGQLIMGPPLTAVQEVIGGYEVITGYCLPHKFLV